HSWQQPAFDSATLCVAPDWTFAPAVGADPSTLVSPDGHVRIAIHQGINPLVGQPCAEPHRTWGEGGPATVCIEDRGNQTVYRFLYDSLRYVELTVDDAYVDYLFQGQMLAMQVREQYSLPGGSPEQAVSHFVAGEVPQCASRAGSQPCLSEARATPEGNFLVSLLSAPGGETLAEYFVLSGTGGGGYLVDVSQSSVGTEPG
ncbi:MAG TPA: hypothetical protein VFO84_09825, partial [Dehalococcoidia bacterium]|nr:hypothetical protein [Dehalococcoidia bacterium]